jgi:hypothetical protein
MRIPVTIAAVALLAACQPTAAPDPANATYTIERDAVTLVGGKAERPVAPGSAAKQVTSLAEQRTSGDIDGDGRPDAVVVLVHQPGGSGTFYYLTALLNLSSGAKATNAILLGDRVLIQAVKVDGSTIVVDYLVRRPGEPLSAQPTVATTMRSTVQGGILTAQR